MTSREGALDEKKRGSPEIMSILGSPLSGWRDCRELFLLPARDPRFPLSLLLW